MVEATLRGEARERLEEVFPQRAADAAIGELDHLLLLLQHAAATHELRVDVDRSHVVDDDGDPEVCAVVQHVVEQRRFPGAKEAGEHRHRQRPRATSLAHDLGRLDHRRVRGGRCGDDVTPREKDASRASGCLEVIRLEVGAAQAIRSMNEHFVSDWVTIGGDTSNPPNNVIEGFAGVRH